MLMPEALGARMSEMPDLDDRYRCEDGRRMRHDPQPDDPYLETDVGPCPICDGKGCEEGDENGQQTL